MDMMYVEDCYEILDSMRVPITASDREEGEYPYDGTMVVLSLEAYSRLTDGVETALDEADCSAMEDERRYTHEEVFSNLRRRVNGGSEV